jgi:hypothetical protein
MKLSQFDELARLVKQRDDLLDARARVMPTGSAALGVTINGQYQDKEMVESVRDAVLAEMGRRLGAIDRSISALDIKIDA